MMDKKLKIGEHRKYILMMDSVLGSQKFWKNRKKKYNNDTTNPNKTKRTLDYI